jgi:hypothetical protein
MVDIYTAFFAEVLHDRQVPLMGGGMEGCVAIIVCLVGVRTEFLDEAFYDSQLPPIGGGVKGHAVIVSCLIDVCAGLVDQVPHNLQVAMSRRDNQRLRAERHSDTSPRPSPQV